MAIEYREIGGTRMTFVYGKRQPLWEVAVLARRLGSVRRMARRLRWSVPLVREALWHIEWHLDEINREHEEALQSGLFSNLLIDSPHALVFPGSRLRTSPGSRATIRPKDMGRF